MLKGHGGCLSALRGREMGMEKVQCWEGAAFSACSLEREESAREGLTPRPEA